MLQANLVHVSQSKLAVSTGGVKKHNKKGKKALKAIARKGLEAAPAEGNAVNSPSHSPSPSSSSPEDAEKEQRAEIGSSSNHSSVSQRVSDSSHAAEGSPNNRSEPERQKNACPVSSTSDGDSPDGSRGPSGPETNTEAAFEDSIDPQGITTVPSSTAFKRLVKRDAPVDPDSKSVPVVAGGLQGLNPSKDTPSKATPNKRPREAACSSPAANSPVVGLEQGPEGGVPESTPGKRRRSLLPQSTLLREVSQ